jgi:hypothetical protein
MVISKGRGCIIVLSHQAIGTAAQLFRFPHTWYLPFPLA